ncbi:secreted RxLR effector protein 161-like [Ipomoea triloba]|uniref:secreted RxLR effector protein 161-like n=1 Tax=Ipomoea triloba TaxID=35885 RepID=UPI00125E67AA|nr:secreted RxLR effector protein 161-like [Ipomoea triloba]
MTELLRKAGMESRTPLATPMSNTMSKAATGSTPLDDLTPYRQLVGSLMYLLVTRPDLSFPMNRLCLFMHSPTEDHWAALKRVLQYVKSTLTHGLRLAVSQSPMVYAFSDSDWVGCSLDRKSTASFAMFLGSNLIPWVSCKQRTVARSSTKAEYKALADVAVEVVWVQLLLRELMGNISVRQSGVSCEDKNTLRWTIISFGTRSP